MNHAKNRVVVVGSGAGGAVLGYRLVQKGYDVTILEAGRHVRSEEMSDDELAALATLYKDGGLQLSTDFELYVIQGSCVGGSTVINDAICLRLHGDDVLNEWAALGAPIDRQRLDVAYGRIEGELKIRPLNQRVASAGGHLFAQGCQALGLPATWFDNNRIGCLGTGLCNLGCQFDRKQSMLITYLPWAVAGGAELRPDCRALRIRHARGRVLGVECRLRTGEKAFVPGDYVIVSCGAISSSSLLLRSKIRGNVGTRLSFNAGGLMHGEFAQTVNTFDGISMCNYAPGHAVLLETLFGPPGAYSLTMPGWFEEHAANMRRYSHFMRVGALVGTRANGRVILDLLGNEAIVYWMSPVDLQRLKEGLKLAARVLLAAGATRVVPTTFHTLEIRREQDVARIDTEILQREDLSIGSAHPQGGNPMSDDPEIGVVDTAFRVHGFDNLFVCDASVFPASVRVNPQLTVMAMADCAADSF
jgi:choline dehydrogenase-like flavoprotein